MTRALRCDVCGSGYTGNGTSSRIVRHYQLKRYEPLPKGTRNDRSTQQTRGRFVGAGSIDLCDDCWSRFAEANMRPQNRHKYWGNQHGEGER